MRKAVMRNFSQKLLVYVIFDGDYEFKKYNEIEFNGYLLIII